MRVYEYDRNAVVEYARRWALGRNPDYYNFDRLGGDCTNFASQCLFAGCGVMNYTPVTGWYYVSPNNRSASWTGVEFFANFLIGNNFGIGSTVGPFGEEVDLEDVKQGDFIQLMRDNGDFYHTLTVVGFLSGQPIVSAHTFDALNLSLSSYRAKYRCLHVLGYRK